MLRVHSYLILMYWWPDNFCKGGGGRGGGGGQEHTWRMQESASCNATGVSPFPRVFIQWVLLATRQVYRQDCCSKQRTCICCVRFTYIYVYAETLSAPSKKAFGLPKTFCPPKYPSPDKYWLTNRSWSSLRVPKCTISTFPGFSCRSGRWPMAPVRSA